MTSQPLNAVTAAAWPFIDSMNPSADVVALSSVEADLSGIELGQRITVVWRKRPVFIDHRTPQQITRAKADGDADLKDPETDGSRVPARSVGRLVLSLPWVATRHFGPNPQGPGAKEPRRARLFVYRRRNGVDWMKRTTRKDRHGRRRCFGRARRRSSSRWSAIAHERGK